MTSSPLSRSTETEDVIAYAEREKGRMPRAALETLVLGGYQRGLISGGRAAQILGLGVEAFLHFASQEGVPVLDGDAADLEADLRRLRDARR